MLFRNIELMEKFRIVINYFISNFFSVHYRHLYLVPCFYDQVFHCIAYTLVRLQQVINRYVKYVIRIFQTKNMKK